MAHALGDYAYDMPFSVVELQQRSAIPNDLAALAGRRFILASETNDGTRLNEARIKSLTGGDACTARFLHGESSPSSPSARSGSRSITSQLCVTIRSPSGGACG